MNARTDGCPLAPFKETLERRYAFEQGAVRFRKNSSIRGYKRVYQDLAKPLARSRMRPVPIERLFLFDREEQVAGADRWHFPLITVQVEAILSSCRTLASILSRRTSCTLAIQDWIPVGIQS